jgi:hypothetical protein
VASLITGVPRAHRWLSPPPPTEATVLVGLEWSPDHRRPARERRGLEIMAAWETEQLAGRGLGPEAIVDELLAIEVEMWRHAGGLDAS